MKKIGIALLVAVLAIGALWLLAGALVRHPILAAHTGFLFGQIRMEMGNDLWASLLPSQATAERQPITPDQAKLLADALRSNHMLDWNSCALDGDTIFDGWKRQCLVESRSIPVPALRFTSSGRDGLRGTDDDIVEELTQPEDGDAEQ